MTVRIDRIRLVLPAAAAPHAARIAREAARRLASAVSARAVAIDRRGAVRVRVPTAHSPGLVAARIAGAVGARIGRAGQEGSC